MPSESRFRPSSPRYGLSTVWDRCGANGHPWGWPLEGPETAQNGHPWVASAVRCVPRGAFGVPFAFARVPLLGMHVQTAFRSVLRLLGFPFPSPTCPAILVVAIAMRFPNLGPFWTQYSKQPSTVTLTLTLTCMASSERDNVRSGAESNCNCTA